MKSIKYFLMAALCTMFVTSCMDGENEFFDLDKNEWTEPNFPEGSPYGNNNITEDNIITIAQLKTKYSSAFSGSSCVEVKDDVKIKAYVTGNDIGGNIYKQVAVQDATGAIIIGINKAGLCGYLAEGQQIIIDLKGLHVGAYGSQPQIGAPYNGGIGRMAESIWMQHFKLVGDIDANAIQPVDFNSVKDNIAANCGKLVVLKNVTFKNADGTKTLIDGSSSGSNYYAQDIDGLSSTIVRTSSYADFAAMKMPFDTSTGQKVPCDIIGIASRFSNTWQIMIRKTSDITVIE